MIDRLRSTKAGALTPATPSAHGETWTITEPLNEGRGAYPGDTGTLDVGDGLRLQPLNEGRGAYPGDTSQAAAYGAIGA